MQKHVELHAGVEWGQSFVHDGEWRSLRGKQAAEASQNRNESDDFGEIHLGLFDFTLGTA
jgi:hypothetical protein